MSNVLPNSTGGFIASCVLICTSIFFFWYGFVKRTEVSGKTQAKMTPIRYNELEHNRRWGTFVEASDTTYMDGALFTFDTINMVYKRVAIVTIQPTDGKSQTKASDSAGEEKK